MSFKDVFAQTGNQNPPAVTGGSGDTNVPADEAIVILELLDMSGSMQSNQKVVIDALNARRKALMASEDAPLLRMSMWPFNTMPTVLHDFQALEANPELDTNTYRPSGGTALNDTIRDGFKAIKAFCAELRNKGIQVRRAIVIAYTDGEDTSSRSSEQEVAAEAREMLNAEYNLVLFGFGVDAKAIAAKIGFPEKNALNISNSERDIRHAIEVRTVKLALNS